MTITIKRVLFCCIGFLAALVVWPVTELVLYNQGRFYSYMTFSLLQGAIFAMILGAFFGSIQGILSKNSYFLKWGLIIGGCTGLIGGALGGLIGQKTLFILGENDESIYISRAIGFSVLGIFVGITEGLRAKSLKKVTVGFLGGLLGGFIGGFLMEYLKSSRLLGIMIFTTLIGLFYALIEKKLSLGKLRVLNGKLKTKEFNIGQRVTKIGSSECCDINLTDYDGLEDNHITIIEKNGELYVTKSLGSYSLIINDQKVDSHILKYEDVIKLGSLKLFFKSE